MMLQPQRIIYIVWLSLEKIEEIDKSPAAKEASWNDLVIPDNYSNLLLSLVEFHMSESELKRQKTKGYGAPSVQIDLVRGKGRGLIILLHGPPGSGKTSTAETIESQPGYDDREMFGGDYEVD